MGLQTKVQFLLISQGLQTKVQFLLIRESGTTIECTVVTY